MKSLAILIAEDEVLIRADIKEMLVKAGHVICGECGNGLKAVELAKQTAPELAVLDVRMPELDGVEAAHIMHSMNIPVVMVTAHSQPNLIKRAENVHVYGYVVKPVSEQNLLATIGIAYARWQEMSSIHQELAAIKEQLKNQEAIAKARSLVQDKFGISAQTAHAKMLKEAMDKQVTLVQIARKIIEEGTKKK